MLKHFLLVGFVIFYNRYLIMMSDSRLYEKVVVFSKANNLILFAISTIVSVVLVVGAYMSLQGSMYRFVYSISKILMQISKFLINLICVYNLYFWFSLHQNFIHDISYLSLMIFYELLIATCISVRFVDFNYHFQNTLVLSISLALISILFVTFIGPVYMA